jgi:hypothetical protein
VYISHGNKAEREGMAITFKAMAETYAAKCGFAKGSLSEETVNSMGKLMYNVFSSINIKPDRWIIDPKQQNYLILEVRADAIHANRMYLLTEAGFEISFATYNAADPGCIRLVVSNTHGDTNAAKSFYNAKMIERGVALADDKTETGNKIRDMLFRMTLKGDRMVSYEPIDIIPDMEKAGLVSVQRTGYTTSNTTDYILLTEIGRGVIANLVKLRMPDNDSTLRHLLITQPDGAPV